MAAPASFVLSGDTLTVTVDLDAAVLREFERSCKELLRSSSSQVLLDLSRINFVSSSSFGQIFVLDAKCQEAGKALTVRIPEALLRVFKIMRLDELLKLEIV